jgi:hypothetical protein
MSSVCQKGYARPMGNTRRFNPSRRQKVLSLKEQNKQLAAEAGYYHGLATALAAQQEAAKMERPADLEEWLASVIPDMSPEELAEWESMSAEEREAFTDELGQRINAQEKLLTTAPESAS